MNDEMVNNVSELHNDGADPAPSEPAETVENTAAPSAEPDAQLAAEPAETVESTAAPSAEPDAQPAAGPAGDSKDAAVSSSEPETPPAAGTEPQKQKKKGKAGKVILIILIVLLSLILLLAGAAFFTVRAMFTDKMPQAPVTDSAVGTDMDALITSSAKDILFEKSMSVDSSTVNELLDMIKETVNDSVDIVRVDDLFCEFSDSKGIVYSRVYVDTVSLNGRDIKVGRTIPVSLGLDAGFDDPCVILTPSDLRCGTVKVPEFILKKILENIPSDGNDSEGGENTAPVENTARIEDGKIYIDIDDFNSYAEQLTDSEINEMLSDHDTFEAYRAAIGDDSIFNYINDSTDVQISGIGIENDKLVISADVSMLCNRTHDCPNENVITGDYFFFGSYPQSTDQPEPIKWLVLDAGDGKALAISEMLLDCKLYNKQYVKTTWSECSLREWLNDDFYNTAFSDSEKSIIQTVKNSNPDNRITGAAGGPDTEDKVFCLELDEAKNYGKEIELRAVVTDYAISQGAETNSHFSLDGRDTGYWWLRSPGLDNSAAACVYPNGLCSNSGQYFLSLHEVCVRPVIEVSISE